MIYFPHCCISKCRLCLFSRRVLFVAISEVPVEVEPLETRPDPFVSHHSTLTETMIMLFSPCPSRNGIVPHEGLLVELGQASSAQALKRLTSQALEELQRRKGVA